MRLAGLEHPAQLGPFDRQLPILLHESLAFREVHSKLAQTDLLRIRQPHANDVAAHDLPNTCRDRAKKIATLQILDQGIRYVQEYLQSVSLALQFRSCARRFLDVTSL